MQMWGSDEIAKDPAYKDYFDEILGISKGVAAKCPDSGITFDDIFAWNAIEELVDYWFPTVASEAYQKMSGDGLQTGVTGKHFTVGSPDRCSAFIATGSYTRDGQIVVAHNSFVPFEMASPMNVVIDITLNDDKHLVMQSQPGLIHSMTDFYVNPNGLIITETTIGGFCAYNSDGVPEFLRIRKAAQEARNFDDFCDMFWKRNTGGYANTWLVGDTNNGQIMQYETGCKFFNKQVLDDGYFVGFNAPQDPRIRNFECDNTGYADIRRHQGARQVRIPQLMEKYKGLIDEELAKEILADHFDVYLNKENPCSRTICSHYELDAREYMSAVGRPAPFRPQGAIDGAVATSEMAKVYALSVRYGSSCGRGFDADAFFAEHPQYGYLHEFIESRPPQDWVRFEQGKSK